MKATIIVNPNAGLEKTTRLKEALVQKLESRFDEIVVMTTQKPNDALQYSKVHSKSSHSIFVIGGDGTVNEVTTGIIEANAYCHLGIIPTGTYNAFSRMLQISQNPFQSIDELDFNKLYKVDTGRVNDRYFNYLLSIGDLAEAVHRVSVGDKQKFGPLPYYFNGLINLLNEKKRHYRIFLQDEVLEVEASLIIVSLSDFFGDFRLTSVDRHLGDGAANLLVIEDAGLISKLQKLPDLLTGNLHNNLEVNVRPIRKIRIECEEDRVESDVDGDLGPFMPLDIEVLGQRMSVYHNLEVIKE